jgi:plasmid stability protein
VIALSALSIRNLDDRVKERLRVRAARHGRSMEAEVRAILADAVAEPGEAPGLFQAIMDRFGDWVASNSIFPRARPSPARRNSAHDRRRRQRRIRADPALPFPQVREWVNAQAPDEPRATPKTSGKPGST